MFCARNLKRLHGAPPSKKHLPMPLQVHIASVRTVSLLSAVEAKIEAEPNVFAEFVSILQSEPTLRSQANKLKEQYFSK